MRLFRPFGTLRGAEFLNVGTLGWEDECGAEIFMACLGEERCFPPISFMMWVNL